jgi:nitrogen fixation NifU-like protein
MKIHCGQLVEGALRSALEQHPAEAAVNVKNTAPAQAPTLMDSLNAGKKVKVRILQ